MAKARQKILKAASELFSEHGFLGASMEDIARKVGITKAGLYYYFESKKELYLQVLDSAFQKLVAILEKEISSSKNKKESIQKAIEGYLKFTLKEKNLIRSLYLKPIKGDSKMRKCISTFRRKINLKFCSLFEEGKRNLELTKFLLGTIDGVIIETNLFNKKINPKKVAGQIFKIFSPSF